MGFVVLWNEIGGVTSPVDTWCLLETKSEYNEIDDDRWEEVWIWVQTHVKRRSQPLPSLVVELEKLVG